MDEDIGGRGIYKGEWWTKWKKWEIVDIKDKEKEGF